MEGIIMTSNKSRRPIFRSAILMGSTLIALALFNTGCSMKDQEKPAAQLEQEKAEALLETQVIENLAQNVVLKTYADLRKETRKLADLAQDLSDNPSQDRLEKVQAQWKTARVPWESTEGFLFGPVDSLGIDPSIDSWPLSTIDLRQILIDQPNITAEFVKSLGTDVQGFHTAEYLIFGDGVLSNTKSILEMTRPQLNYLKAVTEVLAHQIDRLYEAWTVKHDPSVDTAKPYVWYLENPGHNNEFYSSRKAILQEYAQGIIDIVIEVGKGKISDPLGGDLSAADPSIVESQFSWNSLTDFHNNIVSVENIYLGGIQTEGLGLSTLIQKLNPELDKKIRIQITDAKTSILAIAGPEGLSFTKAIKNPMARQRALNAIATLDILERTMTHELLPLFQ